MAKNSSIVLDIGAKVDKSWQASLNNIGTDLNKLGKHISKNMQQYDKSSEAVQRYQNNVDKLDNIIKNGDSTTMRYTEKIRYLKQQNTNLSKSSKESRDNIKNLSEELEEQQQILAGITGGEDPWKKFQDTTRLKEIQLSFESLGIKVKEADAELGQLHENLKRLIELKENGGDFSSILSDKDKRGILQKADPKDFIGGKKLKEDIKEAENDIKRLNKEIKTTTEQRQKIWNESGKRDEGAKKLTQQLEKYKSELKNVQSTLLKLKKQFDELFTVENIRPEVITNKALDTIDKQIADAEKRITTLQSRKRNAEIADELRERKLLLQQLRTEIQAQKQYVASITQTENKIKSLQNKIDDETESIKNNTQRRKHNKNEIAITQKRRDEYYASIKQRLAEYQQKLDEAEGKNKDALSNMGKTFKNYLLNNATHAITSVINAFNKALINRGLNKDGIFHSDRGSQYTSNDYEKLLNDLEIKHSYSKKGYPYDNASMESFNAILKKEEVNVNNYETFEEAKIAIFEFIESWYNNKRIHSTIGYITPNEKYNNYIANLVPNSI